MLAEDWSSGDKSLEKCALKLCEEAGEVAREIKKIENGNDREFELRDELGDVLSALLKLGHKRGISPYSIMVRALEKRGL
jgi:NTP pyrophosphatase (non-canonical NTP hydrolase)